MPTGITPATPTEEPLSIAQFACLGRIVRRLPPRRGSGPSLVSLVKRDYVVKKGLKYNPTPLGLAAYAERQTQEATGSPILGQAVRY